MDSKRLKRACRLGVAGNKDGGNGLGNIRDLIAALVAEFIGTGLLVGVGCTGGVVGLPGPMTGEMLSKMNESSYCVLPERLPQVSSMQPALVFGLTVAAIIQMFGHISQAHLNPAVTVTAVVLGMMPWPKAILYCITQCLGAIFGFGVLKLITPCGLLTSAAVGIDPNIGFCTTVPSAGLSVFRAILAEGLATAVLVLVVCGVWDKRNAKFQDSAPIKFGLTIAALAMALGPYTGASMNPARTLGPAMWNNVWTRHWIYWLAPLGSALMTSYFYRAVLWPSTPIDDTMETKKGAGLEEDADPLTGVRSVDTKADGATTRL